MKLLGAPKAVIPKKDIINNYIFKSAKNSKFVSFRSAVKRIRHFHQAIFAESRVENVEIMVF